MSHLTTSCCYLPRATDKKVKNAGVRSGNEQCDQQIAVLALAELFLCVSRGVRWQMGRCPHWRFEVSSEGKRASYALHRIVCATFYYEQLKTKERESGMSATTKMEIILTTNASNLELLTQAKHTAIHCDQMYKNRCTRT